MNWGHIAPTAPDTLGSCLRNSLPFYAKAKLEAWGEQRECWFKQFFALGIYIRSNLNHGFMQSVGLGLSL